MANPMYGQNKADGNLDSVTDRYLDFLSGNQANLAVGNAITDAESDAVVAGGATTAEIAAASVMLFPTAKLAWLPAR